MSSLYLVNGHKPVFIKEVIEKDEYKIFLSEDNVEYSSKEYFISKVDINALLDAYPGTYYRSYIRKADAIDFINRGLNWMDYYIYFIGDENNYKYHEDAEGSYARLPDLVCIEKWTKDWFKKKQKSGVLCWVGNSETAIFNKEKIALIHYIHNDQLHSLGGSPRLTYLDYNERHYQEAKPLNEDELKSLLSNDISFESLKKVSPDIISNESFFKSLNIDHTLDRMGMHLTQVQNDLKILESSYPISSDIEELRKMEESYNNDIHELRTKFDDMELAYILYKEKLAK